MLITDKSKIKELSIPEVAEMLKANNYKPISLLAWRDEDIVDGAICALYRTITGFCCENSGNPKQHTGFFENFLNIYQHVAIEIDEVDNNKDFVPFDNDEINPNIKKGMELRERLKVVMIDADDYGVLVEYASGLQTWFDNKYLFEYFTYLDGTRIGKPKEK